MTSDSSHNSRTATNGGALVLVATPIGNLGDMSQRAVDALKEAELICCEDTRHSGKLLSHFGVSGKKLIVINEHTEYDAREEIVSLVASGSIVALVTDAGTPGISDPASLAQVTRFSGRKTVVPQSSFFRMVIEAQSPETQQLLHEVEPVKQQGPNLEFVALLQQVKFV